MVRNVVSDEKLMAMLDNAKGQDGNKPKGTAGRKALGAAPLVVSDEKFLSMLDNAKGQDGDKPKGTAGRKALGAAPLVADEVVDTQALAVAASKLPEAAAQVREAMQAVGYEHAYDRERLVQEAGFYLAHSAEAMLEAGRRLLVIKAAESHGEFEAIVRGRLGLGDRTARRMMEAARKYLLNPALQGKAQPLMLLDKTKLFELMGEDDSDLADLASGGTLAGKTLDDMQAMSKRELQAALREARFEIEASSMLLTEKNKRIDKLQRDKKRIADMDPDQARIELCAEAALRAAEVEGHIAGNFRLALQALADQAGQGNGGKVTPAGGTPRQIMAGMVGQLQAALNQLRAEFDLQDTAGDGTPAYQKWHAEQQRAGKAGKTGQGE